MGGILHEGCDTQGREAERAFVERTFVWLQGTHERAFAVNPWFERASAERVFATGRAVRYHPEHLYAGRVAPPPHRLRPSREGSTVAETTNLTARQREILETIEAHQRDHGYPPSVREIGEVVGLTSPSTVHAHLSTLQRLGFLVRDPSKPRAIEVRFDPTSGAAVERRPMRHVPLVGDVAAGTDVLAQENIEETLPLPADFTGDGDLFMLRVRGDSMVDAAILDGDFVVCHAQTTADDGDIVVAGIPGDEATVKTYQRSGRTVTLIPANERLAPMELDADEVAVYGRVVTVLRRL
jgi:repressor LexA